MERSEKVADLKAKVWRRFSEYIRLRDCPVTGRCVTCGKLISFGSAHAGHYVAGRSNAILLDERNVHAQCPDCNVFASGRALEHRKYIVDKYGEYVAAELERNRNRVHRMTAQDWNTADDMIGFLLSRAINGEFEMMLIFDGEQYAMVVRK